MHDEDWTLVFWIGTIIFLCLVSWASEHWYLW